MNPMQKPMTSEQLELFNKMTELQKIVAPLVLSGMTYAKAYRIARPNDTKPDTTCSSKVKQMIDRPVVKAWMDSMREGIVSDCIMTREEALKRLSTFARADIGKMVEFGNFQVGEDEHGEAVYQSTWKFKNSALLDANLVACISELKATKQGISIKLYDPMTAIKRLSDMEGWDQPKRIDHTISESNLDTSKLSDSAMEEILDAQEQRSDSD